MEATATETKGPVLTCDECDTENRSGSSFCKSCGGTLAPPPVCPKCEAEVPDDAKFCSECGAKLVGARPKAAPKKKAQPAPAAKAAAKKMLDEEAKQLPKAPRKPTSNIGSNLLFFVAILMAIIVVIYVMNKDAPKEVSPFQGGGAPFAGGMKGKPPSEGAVAAGGVVKGSIRLSEELKDAGNGTIYLIVRNKGMPNAGPPVAVRRLDGSSFPVEFTVSAADVMMPNMPFTGPFDIYARLDRDGNAMTKQPGDVINEKPHSGAKPGDEGVEIVLNKKL